MNAFAVHHRNNPLAAVLATVGVGFVPYAGVALPALAAFYFIRRNRDNRGLCLLLIAIAVIFALLWIAYIAWQGGSSSVHHSHPVKVP